MTSNKTSGRLSSALKLQLENPKRARLQRVREVRAMSQCSLACARVEVALLRELSKASSKAKREGRESARQTQRQRDGDAVPLKRSAEG